MVSNSKTACICKQSFNSVVRSLLCTFERSSFLDICVCVCVCKGILKYSEIRSLDGKRNGFLLLRQSGEIKTETLSKSSCRMVKLGS